MSTQLVQISPVTLPALVAAAGEHAGMRFLEFFGPTSATRTRFAPRSGADQAGVSKLSGSIAQFAAR
jgi:hypothetical protein